MRAAPDVAASANVDYVKRLTDFTVSVTNGSSVKLNTAYTYSVTPVYSDGTLTGTITSSGGYLELDSSLQNSILSSMAANGSAYADKIKFVGASNSAITVSGGTLKLNGATPFDVFVQQSASVFGGETQLAAAKTDFNNEFARRIKNYGVGVSMANLSILCEYKYNGELYNGVTMKTVGIRFDGSAFSITPTGVSVDKGSLIF